MDNHSSITRVLKAPTEPVADLQLLMRHLLFTGSLLASDKEDGIRCIIHPVYGVCSQTLKSIPNHHVRRILEHAPLHLDGELVALDSEGQDLSFNDTQSAIMTQGGMPRFEYRCFDDFSNPELPYKQRLFLLIQKIKQHNKFVIEAPHISWLAQTPCRNVRELEQREEDAILRGKEGLMLRRPDGIYKEGRSTFNEGYLLKVKRFMDDEAIVIGVEEEMENCNLATRDARGLQVRTKHQDQLKGKGRVGVLVCNWKGKTLRVASGMSDKQKQDWWDDESLVGGHTITFKYQKHGMKDLPRTPVFKGIRYD